MSRVVAARDHEESGGGGHYLRISANKAAQKHQRQSVMAKSASISAHRPITQRAALDASGSD